MRDFVHLHVHTEYSLLDGACRIGPNDKNHPAGPLMEHIKAMGQKAVAITDHGVMYGAIDFYKAAKQAGIKPIIGCELYVAQRTMADRTYELDSNSHHLVALCKNETGYKNLIYLTSQGFIEGFYVKPRVDFDLLQEHKEGLVILSGCLAGEVQKYLASENYDAAKECAEKYDTLFGRGNYYLELQDHGIEEQQAVNAGLIRLSKETGIPLVATNDAHYIARQDAEMHDVLLCIQTGKTIEDENRLKFTGKEFYLKSGDEMASLFPYCLEAIENTVKIADMCQLDFTFGEYHLPVFTLPEGETDAYEYLKKVTYAGFEGRYKNPPQEYIDRMNYELEMINTMGFVEYFLIVHDFIDFAHKKGIPVGPGRGSGAGSIVAYSLRITGVDPMRYSLLFERFLNPDRISMPDFDIDFCPLRRQEVIDYVTQKYGEDHVAQIVTFGTMAARGAVRDTGRALNMPYIEVDLIAKLIPPELKITLDRALETSPELKRYYNDDERVKKLIDTAKQVEGMPRNASTHAAGVIIAAAPVYEYVPLAKGDQGVVTQYTMSTLEELGLLKMDFLGLRNLTVIDDTIKMVNAAKQAGESLSIDDIDYDDANVFEMISRGDTGGIFQIESSGMTGVAMGLKPKNVEDLNAIIALFRPGPMQQIPTFLERAHNPKKIKYKHELLKPILEVTYGCMVYQEQVMEIFRALAGYSLGRADLVRRAMSKKKFDLLASERENFVFGNEKEGIVGCAANGVGAKTANEIFDEMLDFANYAFNRAHSASYAVLAYQTAYLKYHFPKEYMAALLTSVLDSTTKVSEYISMCKDRGINVLPPDINESRADFTVSGDSIRFGIGAVKNVGIGFIEKMVLEREENGAFKSFDDFCMRMGKHDLNKRALENLIKCGAFDSFKVNRSVLLSIYISVLDSASSDKRRNIAGQINLFEEFASPEQNRAEMPDIPEFSKRELLSFERETTGLYLSGHPMDTFGPLAKMVSATPVSKILALGEEDADDSHVYDGAYLTLAGVIVSAKVKVTKKNTTMAYLTIEDTTGSLEMLAFESVLARSGSYMQEDMPVLVFGKVSAREDEEPKIICEDIQPLTPEHAGRWEQTRRTPKGAKSPPQRNSNQYEPPKRPVKLHLRVPYIDHPFLGAASEVMQMYPGTAEVNIYGQQDGRRVRWNKACVRICDDLLDELRVILSDENVTVK